jgi:predicted small lipoprotein YifL
MKNPLHIKPRTRNALLVGFVILSISACGKKGNLEAAAGAPPIPKAYGQAQPASAEQLTTAPIQTRPGRSDELLRRSDRRVEDPFDLPAGSNGELDIKPATEAKAATDAINNPANTATEPSSSPTPQSY